MAHRSTRRDPPIFGQRLAALRRQHGLTQPELGDKLGISTKMVDYYEHRARNPSIAIVQRAAELFAVSVADLLGEGAVPPPTRKKPGPPSALEERIEQLRKLPRTQQDVVIKMIDGLLAAASR
ncbi:MAG: helix-turn-helix transcriptional regulator [Deltaproteobacteria bacterium]|nr:helix-turn-helix transcriptional regulator [Deltaproteobacteria bacterium]